jgi:hypothetical protein
MKKVQTNKLTLGKMTVAKLRLSEQQMQRINGGEDTAKPQKPIIGNSGNSLADDPNNQCVTSSLGTGLQG